MPDLVFVLGMHRSGTSSVAGALTKLGGAAPNHLMGASATNARGHFESVPFNQLHEQLLASAGTYWHDWRRFNPSWYRSPAAGWFKQQAKEIFAVEFGDAVVPVLKDARICRFLPFWIDVLEDLRTTPRFVIPIRSPLDVAYSLAKRDSMLLYSGVLLWLRHVLDAEVETRHAPRSIFVWADFVSDWRRIVEKISLDIELSWPRLSDHSAREVELFLSSELVHNKFDHAELVSHSAVHCWAVRAYGAMLELARDPHSASARDALDEVRDLFESSCAMFGRVLADYEAGLQGLSAQVETGRNQARERELQQEMLQAELVSVRAERDRLALELQSRVHPPAEPCESLDDRGGPLALPLQPIP